MVRDVQDAARKEALLQEAEAALAHIKRGADLLAGVKLLGLKAQDTEDLQVSLVDPFLAGELDGEIEQQKHPDAFKIIHVAKDEHIFNWELEIPEVFENKGFDAFVGNPPFIGGRKIRGAISGIYFDYLTQRLYPGTSGNADICAFFIRRANNLTKTGGANGFVATSSISEGDTRDVCLQYLLENGCKIFFASNKSIWPGAASVTFSPIVLYKGDWCGKYVLDEKEVSGITAYLTESETINKPPYRLKANEGLSYQGSIPLGKGFVITAEEASNLLKEIAKMIW